MTPAIRFEHVSKRYRVGRSRTLVDVIASTVGRVRRRRREDVIHTRWGRINATLWALSDVGFDVAVGESLGIIGANGAGKTTILKLISRVTRPTSGKVHVRGRVVSLIELGAGFHPELTGRENVYLSGSLVGLSRRQVAARFDEIVAFAEVERFIDTPMKRYSSGLYARLGFSVAIHSDPDIVLVDEVLAVGDAAFRRRAVDRLQDMHAAGKTVVFISHDMWSVRRLCRTALWMDAGRVRARGPTVDVTDRYMTDVTTAEIVTAEPATADREGTGEVRFRLVRILDPTGDPSHTVRSGEPLWVRASYHVAAPVRRPLFHLGIVDVDTGVLVSSAVSNADEVPEVLSGDGHVDWLFESLPLGPRRYALRLGITDRHRAAAYDLVPNGPRFVVVPEKDGNGGADDTDDLVRLTYSFSHTPEREP